MFVPQTGKNLPVRYSETPAKRSSTDTEHSRKVKGKVGDVDTISAREAGKAASCSGLSDPWHHDLTDYGESINKRVRSMIEKSTNNIEKGLPGLSEETVTYLAKLKLCRELDSFILFSPESSEVKKGLNRALLRAVDEGDPGMVAYLIVAGANPLCQTGGLSSSTVASAINDGSDKRSKVVAIIEQGLKTKSR